MLLLLLSFHLHAAKTEWAAQARDVEAVRGHGARGSVARLDFEGTNSTVKTLMIEGTYLHLTGLPEGPLDWSREFTEPPALFLVDPRLFAEVKRVLREGKIRLFYYARPSWPDEIFGFKGRFLDLDQDHLHLISRAFDLDPVDSILIRADTTADEFAHELAHAGDHRSRKAAGRAKSLAELVEEDEVDEDSRVALQDFLIEAYAYQKHIQWLGGLKKGEVFHHADDFAKDDHVVTRSSAVWFADRKARLVYQTFIETYAREIEAKLIEWRADEPYLFEAVREWLERYLPARGPFSFGLLFSPLLGRHPCGERLL